MAARSADGACGGALVVLAVRTRAQSYTYERYMAYMVIARCWWHLDDAEHRAATLERPRTFAQPVATGAGRPDPCVIVRVLAPPAGEAQNGARYAVIALLAALFISPAHGADKGQPPDVMYLWRWGSFRARRGPHETCAHAPGAGSPEAVRARRASGVRRNVILGAHG